MKYKLLLNVLFVAVLASCSDDDDPSLSVPESYEFTRDGQSTVDYQGQTDRLNMAEEIVDYISTGSEGASLESAKLLDMYANENVAFSDPDLNASSKQLEDKTFAPDVQWVKDLFVAAADASQSGTPAAEGQAGLIERGPDRNMLVSEKGWDFKEFVEKGFMGAVFYNQIFNTYLANETADDVDNEALVSGKNYTAMEHHWDEAFGYWGVPADFPHGDPVLPEGYDRFWAEYTTGRDALLGTNEKLMNAYLKGRAAIVAKQYSIKNEQKEIIYDTHELVAAATAVHYLNSAMGDLSAGEIGNLFHHLSEAYNFVKILQYSPNKKITPDEIDEILNTHFGTDGNFWEITKEGGLDKLKAAKAALASVYPEIDTYKDQL